MTGGRSLVEIGFATEPATIVLRGEGFVSEGNESSPRGSVEHPAPTTAQKHKSLLHIARLVGRRFAFIVRVVSVL